MAHLMTWYTFLTDEGIQTNMNYDEYTSFRTM